jgi:alpha-L-arabinofuranosidase
MLDATATCDPSGTRLTIAVVNRDRDRAHRASIELGEAAAKGDALVSEVNGASVEATNSFDTPRAVDVREAESRPGAIASSTSSRRTRSACSACRSAGSQSR